MGGRGASSKPAVSAKRGRTRCAVETSHLKERGGPWALEMRKDGQVATCGQQNAGLLAAWPPGLQAAHAWHCGSCPRGSGHRWLALLRPLQTDPPQPSQHLCPGSRMKIWVPGPLHRSVQASEAGWQPEATVGGTCRVAPGTFHSSHSSHSRAASRLPPHLSPHTGSLHVYRRGEREAGKRWKDICAKGLGLSVHDTAPAIRLMV